MMSKILLIGLILFLSGCSTPYQLTTQLPNPNINLGIAYLQQNEFEKARLALNRAIQENPRSAIAWGALGYLEELCGNNSLAKNYYLYAIRLDPRNGESYNNYGVYLCRQGQAMSGIKNLLKAASLPSYIHRGDVWENAGLCALMTGDQPQAIRYFEIALRNDPNRSLSQKKLSELKVSQ